MKANTQKTSSQSLRKSSRILAGSIAALLALHSTPAVCAANVTWDSDGQTNPADNIVTGGSGAWNLVDTNWTTDVGLTNILWNNAGNDTAIFGGAFGTVTLGTGITVGGLTFNDNAGYVVTGNTLTFGASGAITTNVDASIASVITGTGVTITKSGAGALTLSNTNTYTGQTTVTVGTLNASATDALGTGADLLVNGGTVDISTFNNTVGAVTLTSGSIAGSTGTLTGTSFSVQSGAISANLAGVGAVLTKSTGGTMALSGTNTYNGGTDLNGGVLALGSAGALGTVGTISFGGGTLQFSAANTTDYSARFSTAPSQAYSLDTNGQNVTLATTLTSATATLAKAGAGTLTLTGVNSLDSATISGGTIAGGTLNLGLGATALTSTGTSAVNSGVVINSLGSTITSTAGTLTLGGTVVAAFLDLTFAGAGDTAVSNAIVDATNLFKTGAGTLTLAAQSLNTLTTSGGTVAGGTITLDGGATALTGGGTSSINSNVIISTNAGTITSTAGTLTLGGTVDAGSLDLTFAGAGNTAVSNAIVNATNLFKTDAGTLTLAAQSLNTLTTSGGTVAGGTITLDGGATALTGFNTAAVNANVTFATNPATITSGGTLTLGGTVDAGGMALTITGATTLSNAIANGTTLTKSGGGTLTLAGSNVFTSATVGGGTTTGGTLTLSGGATALASSATSAVNSNVTIATNPGTITSDAGTLTLGGTVDAGSAALTFDGAGNSTVTNAFLNATTLTKNGGGTLTVNGSNSYTGGTSINGGVLAMGNGNAIGTAGTISFGGGTLRLFNTTDLSARFSTAASQLISIDTNGQNVTFGTALTSSGGTLTKSGAGALTLGNAASAYSGKTIVQAGTLNYTIPLTNAGAAGPLGAPTGANGTIDLFPGTTFQYNGVQGSGGTNNPSVIYSSTDRSINLAGTGPGTVALNGQNINDTTFRFNGAFTATGTGVRTLQITARGDRPLYIYNGGIPDMSDTSQVTVSLIWSSGSSSSNGRIELNGNNTFTGPLNLTGGNNGGPGTVLIGGSGVLGGGNYAGNITFTPATAATVVLDYGSSANQTLSGLISGPGALTKSGLSTLTLSGTGKTYTGATTINLGLLRVNSSTGASAVAVNAGGALGGTGTVGGAVTAAVGTASFAGGAIRLTDGAEGTLSLSSTLTFSGTTALPNSLYLDLGTTAGTNDQITATGTIAVTNAAGAVINLKPTVNGGTIGDGLYTLITGSAITNPGNFALATTAAFGKTFVLSGAGVTKQVTVATAAAGPATAFWQGGANPWTTVANWNTDAASSVPLGAIPGVGTNVTFSTTTPVAGNLTSNTLSADFEINSLTFNAAGGGVTIGGTNRLTLDAVAANGITSSNTSGTNTISANVGLGGSQTWDVSTGGSLTIGGGITDFGSGFGITKSGGGTLTLSVANTSTGGVTLNNGRLDINNANAVGTGPLTIAGGSINVSAATTLPNNPININGSFTFAANANQSLNTGTSDLTLGANSTITVTQNTLTIPNAIGDGASDFNLTKAGAGTMTLSSPNSTYSGKTSVQAGTLNYTTPLTNAGVAGPLGAPTGANGTIDLFPGTTFQYTGAQGFGGTNNPSVIYSSTDRSINLAGTGPGTVALNGQNINDTTFRFNGAFTATGTGVRTLQITARGDRPLYIYNGGIPDMSDASPVTVSLIWSSQSSSSNGRIELNGNNTFTGPLNLTGGGNGGPGTVLIGGSGVLGGGSYAGDITFTPLTVATVVLNYGSSANQTLSGLISGPGALATSGSGTLTLTAANTFTGQTTLGAGTLTLTNNLALQNSALNTGTAGNLVLSGVTTPTFGGLAGSRNLATVVTSGYGSVTSLTLNPALGTSNTYSGVIADGAAGMTVTKTGAGAQVFQGTQLYTGNTTISAGTLQLGTGTTGQNGSVSSGIVNNAVLAVNNADAQTLGVNISGGGMLTKSGAGTLTLSGTNSYAGPTLVNFNGGILQFSALGAIAAASRNISVAPAAAVALNYIPAGSIQNDLLSKIVATSAGTVALTATASPVGENFDFSSGGNNFTALSLGATPTNSTYTGTLTPNANTYRLGGGGGTLTFNPGGGTFDNTQNLVLFGVPVLSGAALVPTTGTVDFAGASKTFGTISIFGGTTQNGSLTGNSYTADTSAGAATVAANLLVNGGAGLTLTSVSTTLTGSTLNLTGANTYTGDTVVNSGTLNLGGGGANGSLDSGTALKVGTTGSFVYSRTGTNTQTVNGLFVNNGAATIANTVATDTLNLAAISRVGKGTVNFGTVTGAINTTTANTGSTGIIGPWATTGATTALKYAVGAGNIAGLTGTTATANTLANVTNADGNFEYSAAVAAMPASTALTANTLRYSGGATATAINATSTVTLNGLMNAGSGGLTISGGPGTGGILIGATNELVITGNGQLTTITAVIGGTGSQSVTFSSAGALTGAGSGLNLQGTNTFGGGFNMHSGTVFVGNNQALGTGPINIYGGIFDGNGNFGETFGTGNTINVFGNFSVNNNATATWNGAVTLNGSYTINVTRGSLTLNGVVADGGNAYGITKAGASTLNLGNNGTVLNTYTGKTILRGGLTVGFISPIGTAGAFGNPLAGNGTIDMYNGATLNFSPAGATATKGMTDRLINLADNGPGTVTVSPGGNNNGTTPTIGGFTATGTGAKTLIMLNTGNLGAMYVTNSIPDSSDGSPTTVQVPFASTNANEFHIAGVSTFTGPLTIGQNGGGAGGKFFIDGSGQLGSGSYANAIQLLGNGGASSSATFVYNSSAAQTLAGVVSGAGFLTKSGAGTLTLSGANTYTGVTTLTSGILSVGTIGNGGVASGNLGSATSAATNLVFNGGTLQYTGATASTDRNFTINTGTTATIDITNGANTLTMSGASTATSGALSKIGAGTLVLTGTNLYTGVTSITNGVLSVGTIGNGGVAGNLGAATNAAANLIFNGGTLQYTGNTASTNRNFTINAATTGTIDIANGANTLTLSGASTATSGALTKVGAGTLTLTGTNLYTGLTTISAGTLEVFSGSGTAIADAGAVSIASVAGAKLLVSTIETIGSLSGGTGANGEVALEGNTLTVGDATETTFGGTISGTATTGTLIKQGTGVLNLASTAVLTFDTLTANDGTINVNSALGTSTGTGVVDVSGATTKLRFGSVSQTLSSLTIGAGSTVIFTSGAASGAFSGGGGGGKAPGLSGGGSVVPEPGTLGLLLVGALGVLNRRRRQA